MGLTSQLCEDLYQIQILEDADIDQLRLRIIDFFAALYAGYRQNQPINSKVEKIVLKQGGAEEASVFLKHRKYPAQKAAFLNSFYAHGAELDDGNKMGMGHIGVHVIPSVFALAESINAAQEDVFLALATGYEAFIRIASAAQPGMVKRGFHSTGMAGAIACAAACARVYQLNGLGIENAVALATTMSGGLLSYGESRPAIKPLNPAKAAENGVFAAMLASEGVQGPTEALEGVHGWFHAVTDEVNEDRLRGTGRLLLHNCYFKMYPSCRHTHCVIDAAIHLHTEVVISEVEAIRVYIYPNAINLAGRIRSPKDPNETKFSIHYTLACALVKGEYGIQDMDPMNASPEVFSLIQKIELIPDKTMENQEGGIRGARIEVQHKSGNVIRETVLIPRGDPENPVDRDVLIHKLKVCADCRLKDSQFENLINAIENMGGNSGFVNPIFLAGMEE